MDDSTPPSATGSRLSWPELPLEVREQVEALLGSTVLQAVTQPGGFSPGVAARLSLANGDKAFVKAVGPKPNPDSAALHRTEARVAAALPAVTPAPRLLGSFEYDGWVSLLFEDVDGRQPAQPWQPDELVRVLAALAELADALTPSPIEVPTAAELLARPYQGWRRLARAQARGEELAGLDPWALHNLAGLAELEAGWQSAASGDCLAHGDVRADNVLLTSSRVLLVDWPWACLAQPWFDLMGMLPSVRMQGGPPCEQLFGDHPTARGADPAAVLAVLAAQTGYWIHQGRQPAPPGLPTLRPFQHAQGMASLEWLKASWSASA